MEKASTIFLRGVILLIAITTLAGLIRFPQTEGRAANLDLVSIYADPLIIYAYIASIPFFVGLYQAFKLLGFIDKNKIFSQAAVKALKTIKYCALSIPVLIALGLPFIVLNADGDDFAGPVALGIYVSLASLAIAAVMATFERLLRPS